MGSNPESGKILDVIIVGAGISGINTAYYLQTRGPKNSSYAILERRGRIGGTWDLFQYPGVRSDSDVYTYGFSWNLWQGEKPISPGDEICAYLSESAAMEGIDKHIRFHQHIVSVDWSSESSTWRVTSLVEPEEKEVTYCSKFLVLGTGYYDYDMPLPAIIPGIDNFQGTVIQPQFWPEDLDYLDKNVVIIGSGATAITLLPNIARDAGHVTMLQRSPSYIFPLPMKQLLPIRLLLAMLPLSVSGRIKRIEFAFLGYLLYYVCQYLPSVGRFFIRSAIKRELPAGYDMDPNLTPRYNPWDQRLCITPGGDFYAALRSTKADIVTDVVSSMDSDSIRLQSGKVLRPDIIILATGVKLSFAGKIKISVDGRPTDLSSKFSFKACMVQDVPNLAFIIGYANASWTLGAEATSIFLARLWNAMESQKIKSVVARLAPDTKMKEASHLDLDSTYIKAGAHTMPKAGEGLWAPKRVYYKDLYTYSYHPVLEGLETR
ncbi:putative flavoprotein CzcO associated with the cation diffusion facilitator CzcD [Geosmithia morbida]|uniref:Flavoprotein CzcO associated with the cation diffusion facilitator CzcD n=1 Tax=Geosmithia morbida TaxID=1094350 RepID=A0A9P5D359_9HYPO|nr:putative flavoprotein CzcO associated with the cation diffusion facilitator CzcD [Geosmithia morbida]KAF4121475.1 putative flavoprotein CzcO associated with the cation diffusion facilitator CzcD [Geosmithia morbida]